MGYWQEIEKAGELRDVPLIISSVDKAEKVWPYLQDTHQSEFYGLRPEVLLVLHIRKDLWDEILEKQEAR